MREIPVRLSARRAPAPLAPLARCRTRARLAGPALLAAGLLSALTPPVCAALPPSAHAAPAGQAAPAATAAPKGAAAPAAVAAPAVPAAPAAQALASRVAPPKPVDKEFEHSLSVVLERAFPGSFGFDHGGMAPPGDARLFADTLASPAFLHAAVGPFDVYVAKADGLLAGPVAQKTLDAAVKGLTPLATVMAHRFAHAAGSIAGQRFPIVLASADAAKKQTSFEELIALTDWCDAGEWTHDNGTLFTPANRGAVVVRTWRVQLVNLAHGDAVSQGDAFLAHGLGYYELAHLVFRLVRLGSWGLSPPWFDQGLTDELDIEAYGEAWVGGDWYTSETAGWYRPGWSGFVPQGQMPPAPVTGPPADLATKVSKSGDSWQHRKNSPTRHWDNLVADMTSAAPLSFRFMADHESFLPRDRAAARCLMHILLDVVPEEGAALLAALDRLPTKQDNGMFDSDPLPETFAHALGGLKSVDALAKQPMRTMLPAIGHKEIVGEFVDLGADGVLDIDDHRLAGAWLYGHPEFDPDGRGKIFNLILTAEFVEQHAEWQAISDALDHALRGALAASKTYPKDEPARAKVAAAFRAGWEK